MASLYVDRRDSALRREGEALVLYVGGERQSTVPINLLERVVLRGNVDTDTGVLGALGDAGVAVVLLSGRHSRNLGTLIGPLHGDADRRLAQYALYQDTARRTVWARYLVRRKLLAQERLLRRALASRPDARLALTKALDTLGTLRARLAPRGDATDLATLLGIEGAAAAAYFGGYAALFAPSLRFTGRNRRPPRDPVNACLSLAYTLGHAECLHACHIAGLDPFLGFFHEPLHGRESLASDLLEPMRPRFDAWVWGLFRERSLREDHFTTHDGACLLGKAGRSVFYAEYEVLVRPLRRMLRRVLLAFVRALVDDVEGGAK
jgi:CRISPR-associated protein Cas1